MIPPGLAFVSVGARAREAAAASKTPRFYFDFARMLKSHEAGDTPFTPAISLVRALLVTLERMKAEGWRRCGRGTPATGRPRARP